MSATSRFGASIDGSGYFMFRQGTTVAITFGDATVIGDDGPFNLIACGGGDVTFFAGDGYNIAQGGAGNDMFVGGTGYNRFFGGWGNDVLIGGLGANDLNGGYGNDTVIFGQNDVVSGGPDADHFVFVAKPNMGGGTSDPHALYPEYAYVRDLNFAEGDTFDLSMNREVHRSDLTVYGDALFVFEPGKFLVFENVGHQVTLVGGIDNAIQMGMLQVAGSDFGAKG